jgi:DNA topoisomerase-1
MPKSGRVVVTEDKCDEHPYMFKLKIIKKGARPWDFGCPYCNFQQWQDKVKSEKKGEN